MTSILTPPAPPQFSLDDRYTREEGLIYLSGIQALVRLPLDQHRADLRRGLTTATFIAGYRGSPLGGFDLELERQAKLMQENLVYHSPGLNEELGATAVWGSQMLEVVPGNKYDGVLGMWYGKAPGVDRTGDVFKHANLSGTAKNGGVLALAGDDPSSKSSTLPSHSEVALYDALIPTLYPGTVQEILDLGLHGFMLSRNSGLWAGMKIVTNVADGAGTAEVAPDRITPVIPTVELDGRPFTPQMNLKLLPPVNLELERQLHYARLELARSYAWENGLNQILTPAPSAWLGILTAGKTYYDVRQALTELGLDEDALARYGVRILKMGMLFPMEPRIVKEFARGLQEILVIEEKRSFLEMFAKDILYGLAERPAVVGKVDEEGRPLVASHSELDSDMIARAIASRLSRRMQIDSVSERLRFIDAVKSRPIELTLARTPYFCSGCPHNRSTVVPEGSVVGAGIGCHGMAVLMEPEAVGNVVGSTQMGGEGAQFVGMAPFTTTDHFFQNLGDGTFFHSGSLAVRYAVASGINITYKLLYNAAVAMTGGQAAAGSLDVPDLTHLLQTEGVKRIIVTTDDADKYRGVSLAGNAEVWHRDRILEAQETLAKVKGVTALIHDQQCAAEKRRLRKRGKQAEPTLRAYINERVCEYCGDCGRKSNCLSVQPVETEFGRKTMIHQSSCNKDYSCLRGDCPSFLTVEPRGGAKKTPRRAPKLERELLEPVLKVPSEGFAVHMMGIGGTGVVTVNQILATAATIDGRRVWGLDQTGLSQKGGPVVSDLKLASRAPDSSKISVGGADLYLGFDLLVAGDPNNLGKADARRTIAVVSTSQVPTGQMVRHNEIGFPGLTGIMRAIDGTTRKDANIYLDAEAVAERLFGNHLAANMLLLGAAYQAGALPVAATAIEQAIRLNGTAVEMNLQAFRWGRMAVVDPAYVEVAVQPEAKPEPQRPPLSAAVRRLIDWAPADSELHRLLEVRVPDLIDYQDEQYARRYVALVRCAARAEQAQMPGRMGLAEAVARYFYKLLAYKDEYEVARLHLDPEMQAQLHETFGDTVRVSWKLHPPMLRALGLKEKLTLGPWFTPAMQSLKRMKTLRGTPLDPFGFAEVRRVERALIPEYEATLRKVCERLTPRNYALATKIAELPDMARGYEQIKLDNVARYHEALAELTGAFNAAD